MAMNLSKLKGIKAENNGIGSGLLNAASKEAAFGPKAQLEYIHVSKIVPNEKNFYSQEEIEERAESIKQVGQLEPIGVIPIEDGKYKIFNGESRYRAILSLYQREESDGYVMCIVDDFSRLNLPELTQDEIEELMIIEPNVQRRNNTTADLMREAAAKKKLYAKLKRKGVKEVFGMELTGKKSREIVAETMGITETQAQQYLTVNEKGSDELKKELEQTDIKIDAAYAVAQMPEDEQKEFLEQSKKEDKKITGKNVAEFKKKKEQERMQVPEDKVYMTDRDWNMDTKAIKKIFKEGIILSKENYERYQSLIQDLKNILE